jgi:endoglucanase Acf2
MYLSMYLSMYMAVLFPVSAVPASMFTTPNIPDGAFGVSDAKGVPAFPMSDVPISTHDWWDSLAWKYQYAGDAPNPFSLWLHAAPLSFRATQTGLWVSAPVKDPILETQPPTEKGLLTATLSYVPTKADIVVNTPAGAPFLSAQLQDHGDFHAKGVLLPGNFTFTMASGVPCVYLESSDGFKATFDLVATTTHASDNGLRIEMGDGSVWSLKGQWTSDGDGRMFSSPDHTVGIAYAVDKTDLDIVESCFASSTFDTSSSFTVDLDKGEVNVQLDWGTGSDIPVALLPHHLGESLSSQQGAYPSAKGKMALRLVTGGTFNFTIPYHGVAWEVTTSSACSDFGEWYSGGSVAWWTGRRKLDGYWGGLTIAKIANMVLIANACNLTVEAETLLGEVRDALEDWFTPDTQPLFRYDKVWRTVNGYPDGGFYSDRLINDHHFQYGYIIAAASVVVRLDPEWFEKWGGAVDLLIRDVACTDRNDADFPFLRNFDPWAGHSWATPAVFEYGNNQESSSEAVNFAHALILWGETIDDMHTRDLGVYLYASETLATNTYWFDPPSELERPYAGMFWTNAISYALWWLAPPQGVLGINVQPVTGGSFYFDRTRLADVTTWTEKQPGSDPSFWPDIWALVQSLAGLPHEVPGVCEQQTVTCPYVAEFTTALKAWGQNAGIGANTAIATKFVNGDKVMYYAYNARNIPVVVTFIDGFRTIVKSRTVMTTESCGDCITPM